MSIVMHHCALCGKTVLINISLIIILINLGFYCAIMFVEKVVFAKIEISRYRVNIIFIRLKMYHYVRGLAHEDCGLERRFFCQLIV